jgi:hypothetical protein
MFSALKSAVTVRGLFILALQAALILGLAGAGWAIYRQLPQTASDVKSNQRATTLQIIIRQPTDDLGASLDVPVSLYPVDIIAVRHEFFTEPRAGKRFEDFLKERMKGRSPINARLDKQGNGVVLLAPGSWWLHATLPGEQQLEWRLPVTVGESKQTIELTPQNVYTRTKTF